MHLMQLLNESVTVLLSMTFLLGLLAGSFLNVVIYRIPVMLQRDWRNQCCEFLEIDASQIKTPAPAAQFEVFNLLKPDSHCQHCDAPVRPWQNIPVLSFIFLGGRCASCKKPVSIRYPLVELATAAFSVLIAWKFGASYLTLALLVFTWSLIALTMIDFDHQLLPDNITLPLLWLGLLLNTVDIGLGVSPEDAVLGAIAGYLLLWAVYQAFKLLTGKEGMGYGDFKLLAVLGAWLGWQNLVLIVILSSLAGAAVGIFLLIFLGRDKNVPIPFGPYLTGAGFIALLWGEQISSFYLNNMVL
jgi:leader peptidase (prepilin peptidase) / N-methyltransferase